MEEWRRRQATRTLSLFGSKGSMRIEKEKSERGGVAAYNGGGAEEKTGEPYVGKINRCLGELGYDDGSPVELLRY